MARRPNELPVARGTLERMPRAMPSVDVIDRDAEVFVRAQVPGFRKEEIEISVSGDTLTLTGSRAPSRCPPPWTTRRP